MRWAATALQLTLLVLQCNLCISKLSSTLDARWPALYVLGQQKGGTTSIFEWLDFNDVVNKNVNYDGCPTRHNVKEVHFWNHLHKHVTFEDYLACFTYPSANQLNVDATPASIEYMDELVSHLPLEVKEEGRFIVSLREPIDRAMSWYKHSVCLCMEAMADPSLGTASSDNHDVRHLPGEKGMKWCSEVRHEGKWVPFMAQRFLQHNIPRGIIAEKVELALREFRHVKVVDFRDMLEPEKQMELSASLTDFLDLHATSSEFPHSNIKSCDYSFPVLSCTEREEIYQHFDLHRNNENLYQILRDHNIEFEPFEEGLC